MTHPDDPQQADIEKTPTSPENTDSTAEVGLQKVTKDAIGDALDPVLARKEQKLGVLSAKRESKELSPYDFDLNYIYQLNEAGLPLTRKDMLHETGNQALVLTREDFEVLGCLDFIHASGERMVIEAESLDPKDVFILYPHEVGDQEKSDEAAQ